MKEVILSPFRDCGAHLKRVPDFVNEIVKLREDCQLSKADMGRLLGFGENQYYRYELGEVPSPSNGRLMRTLIDNREALMCAIKESSIKESNKEKSLLALSKLTAKESDDKAIFNLLFPVKRSIYTPKVLASNLITVHHISILLSAIIDCSDGSRTMNLGE